MDCGTAREALSALLDGEALPCARGDLDTHIATCDECQQWREAAHLVTRRARLTSALSVPNSTERILAAVLADRPARPGILYARLLRSGLAATALAHGVIFVPAIVGRAGLGVPLQAARELGVFNITLAVALLGAAVRPAWARAMLPVVGVAAGLLELVDVVDTAGGSTTLAAEAPHLITLLGAVLLAMLTRLAGGDSGGPGQRRLRRQDLLRTLWQRRPHSGLAGFVTLPARRVRWNEARGTARARSRTANADADDGTDGAEDGSPVRRAA
jgi:predicted anti-sigma-YlaC factor YlaD